MRQSNESQLDSFNEWQPPASPSPVTRPLAAANHLYRGIFDTTQRTLREAYSKIVVPTNAWEPIVANETDGTLRARAQSLRVRMQAKDKDDEDDVAELAQAFALVREAVKRTLSLRLYDVQLVGGYVLHNNAIAEMHTGEGKTLVALLPAFVSSLKGCSTLIVTVNDYLAGRDARWAGKALEFLSVAVGAVTSDMDPGGEERRKSYDCDVTYVTNQELGFDYLRDNMATSPDDLVLKRPFHLAIVDEADSVLIDESRNPLLISSLVEGEVEKFEGADRIARQLTRDVDYTVDQKRKDAELTEAGMEKCERLLNVSDVWEEVDPWARYITNAIKANEHYIKDKEYLVRNGEVQIVDEFTGRIMPRRRWSDNVHQAVEAKEKVNIQGDQATVATITYQCFFKLFPKLSGMTGTARTESGELWRTYRLEVVSIPTHMPTRRIDSPTSVYQTKDDKWEAVSELVLSCHAEGRPVLIGTTSVEQSEVLSQKLGEVMWRDDNGKPRTGLPHALLNARPQYAADEARTVSQAGRLGSITIATNMAGRGTDILLGGNAELLAEDAIRRWLMPQLNSESCLGMGLRGVEDMEGRGRLNVQLTGLTRSRLESAAAILFGKLKGEMEEEEANEWLRRINEHARAEASEGREELTAEAEAALEAASSVHLDCKKECELEAELVRQKGGLQIIGTELHDSRRIDNQLRGRAGRQGDPGSTVFLISLEDELVSIHCPQWIMQSMWSTAGLSKGEAISSSVLDFELDYIQKRTESFHMSTRKEIEKYDEVIDSQRRALYSARRKILARDSRHAFETRVSQYMRVSLERLVTRFTDAHSPVERWELGTLLERCRDMCLGNEDRRLVDSGNERQGLSVLLPGVDAESIRDALLEPTRLPMPEGMPAHDEPPMAFTAYLAQVSVVTGVRADPEAQARWDRLRAHVIEKARETTQKQRKLVLGANGGGSLLAQNILVEYLLESMKEAMYDLERRLVDLDIASEEELDELERMCVLRALDEHWQHHLSSMNILRLSVGMRSFGFAEPIEEYAIDGSKSFGDHIESFKRRAIESIFAGVDINLISSPGA